MWYIFIFLAMEEWEEMGFLESQYLAAKVMTLFSMNVAPRLLAEHQQMLTFWTHCLLWHWVEPDSQRLQCYELVSFSQQVGAT